jgi:uncharacterized damage-inducible protein DinB
MDRALIDQYEKGGDDLKMAVRGLDRQDLLAFPVSGRWSIQQLVIHLLDSDLILADRMKCVIAEENPKLMAFDENRFVKFLHYDEQSIDDAVTIFGLNRRNFAKVLKELPDSSFDRVGTHSERGQMKLSDLLAGTVNHLKHHLKFLVEKREKLGK